MRKSECLERVSEVYCFVLERTAPDFSCRARRKVCNACRAAIARGVVDVSIVSGRDVKDFSEARGTVMLPLSAEVTA